MLVKLCAVHMQAGHAHDCIQLMYRFSTVSLAEKKKQDHSIAVPVFALVWHNLLSLSACRMRHQLIVDRYMSASCAETYYAPVT